MDSSPSKWHFERPFLRPACSKWAKTAILVCVVLLYVLLVCGLESLEVTLWVTIFTAGLFQMSKNCSFGLCGAVPRVDCLWYKVPHNDTLIDHFTTSLFLMSKNCYFGLCGAVIRVASLWTRVPRNDTLSDHFYDRPVPNEQKLLLHKVLV